MISLPVIIFFIVFLIGCAIAYPYVFKGEDQPAMSTFDVLKLNAIVIVAGTAATLWYSVGAEIIVAGLYFVACVLIAIASRRWIWLVGGVIGLIPGLITWWFFISNLAGGRV